jgi:hypothetical protein
VPPKGGEPARKTRAILNTGPGNSPGPPTLRRRRLRTTGGAHPPKEPPSGAFTVGGVRGAWDAPAPAGYPKFASRFSGSTAQVMLRTEQRLGLITLMDVRHARSRRGVHGKIKNSEI